MSDDDDKDPVVVKTVLMSFVDIFDRIFINRAVEISIGVAFVPLFVMPVSVESSLELLLLMFSMKGIEVNMHTLLIVYACHRQMLTLYLLTLRRNIALDITYYVHDKKKRISAIISISLRIITSIKDCSSS
jgi:hypothetical protein